MSFIPLADINSASAYARCLKQGFAKGLIGKELDFIVNISASPFHLGKISLGKNSFGLAKTANAFVFIMIWSAARMNLCLMGQYGGFVLRQEQFQLRKRFEEDFLV